MRRILDSTTRKVTVPLEGGGEQAVDEVASVTFEDHVGAVHTLIFHPPGTEVSGDAEEAKRVVGEDLPHYRFATAEEAVDAYENGKVA